jgi:Tfp pilus assembly protein PilO
MLKKSNKTAGAAPNGAARGAQKAAAASGKAGFTLKPSKQNCIAMGAIIGFLVLSGGGLYFWQSQELGKLETEVRAKQVEVESGEKIARRLQTVMDDYNKTQGELRFLETSVTAKEYVPTMLRQTEQLARSVNLKVLAVRPKMEPAPEPPKDPDAKKNFKPQPYDKISIEMQVQGGYWSVAKLLYRLTEFPKILSVEGIQVQTQGQTLPNKAPVLSVNLKLVGFIFPNDGKQQQKPGQQAKPGATVPGKKAAPASSQKTASAADSQQAVSGEAEARS